MQFGSAMAGERSGRDEVAQRRENFDRIFTAGSHPLIRYL
jgi:hypothetical protein